ncbi:MAG: hypothetical protein Q9182_005278 [Xanthomendoza sp. 2 TL-2023]
MAINSDQEARIALSLSAPPNLCLDLWKGFSEPISINVHSADYNPNGGLPPLVEYVADYFDWYPMSATWAFTEGLLAIRDETGTVINLHDESPDLFLPSAVLYLRGYRVNEHKLDRVTRRLLQELRTKLRPGSSYRLGFREKTFPMRALRLNPNSERLRAPHDDHWVQAICYMSSQGVPFEVVLGTPVPRFEAALSVSKTVCGQGRHPENPQYWINVKITSVDKTPVKVKMPDPKFDLVQDGLRDWLRVYLHRKPCGPNLHLVPPAGSRLTWQKDNGAITDTCPSCALDFYQGSSYTVGCTLPAWLCDAVEKGDEMFAKIIAERSGFSAWRYSSNDDDVEHDDDSHGGKAAVPPNQWPSEHGRIEFEPVLDGWEDLERMLEGERLLGKLPFELRRIIYDYIKYAEDVAVKRITI